MVGSLGEGEEFLTEEDPTTTGRIERRQERRRAEAEREERSLTRVAEWPLMGWALSRLPAAVPDRRRPSIWDDSFDDSLSSVASLHSLSPPVSLAGQSLSFSSSSSD